MAVVVQAVVTTIGRQVLAQSLLGTLAGYDHSELSYFQIGEGGWVDTINGRVPKDPDPSRTELEATGAPGDLKFQKALTAADVAFDTEAKAVVTAFVGLSEANDDGLGDSPRFFELGIFDSNDNMIVYATFPEETKTVTKTLNHVITIVF